MRYRLRFATAGLFVTRCWSFSNATDCEYKHADRYLGEKGRDEMSHFVSSTGHGFLMLWS
jgi:hypothetical protein